jgi:two-component sensor histidine kinase
VPRDDSSLDWVLALAPYRRDADYLEELLTQHGLAVRRAGELDDLALRLREGPGLIVATHEALRPEVIELVRMHLLDQADWSEMPIIVLLDRAAPQTRIRIELHAAWPGARQIYYQRPVAMLDLVSGVQSAMLARLRQRDVRDHIGREIELRRELNHRVKNILASVSSIFAMTRRGAVSLDDFAEDFSGRLMALANVHSAVFEMEGETLDLGDVAALTFKPYMSHGRGRIVAAGPKITLASEAATTLALCFHELATNALKYGALSVPEGQVRVDWAISPEGGGLRLSWTESGGPPVAAPKRTGYGTRYLSAALRNLFGSPPVLVHDPEGFRLSVSGVLRGPDGNADRRRALSADDP